MRVNVGFRFVLLFLLATLFPLPSQALGIEFLVGAINAFGSMGPRNLSSEEKMLRDTDFESVDKVSKSDEEAKVKERWMAAKEKGGFVEIEQGRDDKNKYSYTRSANLSSSELNVFGYTEYWLILSTVYDDKPAKSSADREFISCDDKMVVSQALLFMDGENGEGVITKSSISYRNPAVFRGKEAEKSSLYRAICLDKLIPKGAPEPTQGKGNTPESTQEKSE